MHGYRVTESIIQGYLEDIKVQTNSWAGALKLILQNDCNPPLYFGKSAIFCGIMALCKFMSEDAI